METNNSVFPLHVAREYNARIMKFIPQLNRLRLRQMEMRHQACELLASIKSGGNEPAIAPLMDRLEQLDEEKVRLLDAAMGKSSFPNRWITQEVCC